MREPTSAQHVGDARRLVEWSVARATSAETPARIGALACEQLVGSMARYVGAGGATAIFERCLIVSARVHPSLRNVLPCEDTGGWGRLHDSLALDQTTALEITIVLLSDFLQLLADLIGTRVVAKVLSEHRPDVFPFVSSEKN